jgi:hypothetical protein
MFAGAADAAERYGKQKVVYHINYTGGEDDKAYLAAMRNIRNHIETVGKDKLDIKVVLHGDGVGLLKSAKTSDPLKTAVVGLKSDNVGFQVCNFTLTGRKIDPAKDLFDVFGEDIVPSGVAEVAHLQTKGYAYIKP